MDLLFVVIVSSQNLIKKSYGNSVLIYKGSLIENVLSYILEDEKVEVGKATVLILLTCITRKR